MKGNQSHTIPLSDMMATLIPNHDGLAFPNESGNVFNNWSDPHTAFLAACNVAHFTRHDLRRTVSTYLAQLQIAPHVTERLLAHRSGTISGISAIYNRYSYMTEMSQALEIWERFLENGLLRCPRRVHI